jgi:hypothetical protein
MPVFGEDVAMTAASNTDTNHEKIAKRLRAQPTTGMSLLENEFSSLSENR